MSAVLPITPRGPSYNLPRATIIKSASDSGRCRGIDTRTKEEHYPGRPVNPGTDMPESAALNPQADPDRLEAATDQAIAVCGGDARRGKGADRCQ
jgi:hypothetical protein